MKPIHVGRHKKFSNNPRRRTPKPKVEKKPLIEKKCAYEKCDNIFQDTETGKQKYCSQKCYKKGNWKRFKKYKVKKEDIFKNVLYEVAQGQNGETKGDFIARVQTMAKEALTTI